MSYCRWSSDNFGCDIYAYQSKDGYVVHVARLKIVSEIVRAPDTLDMDPDAWLAGWQAHMDSVGDAERAPIGLSYDGMTFLEDTLADLDGRLRMLREVGYRFSDYVLDDIADEMTENCTP